MTATGASPHRNPIQDLRVWEMDVNVIERNLHILYYIR